MSRPTVDMSDFRPIFDHESRSQTFQEEMSCLDIAFGTKTLKGETNRTKYMKEMMKNFVKKGEAEKEKQE